ncbi:MAG: transposase [Deltaproteobacteria bacterium]|nr:transposase [Deltaproteobacteria bacterium]
MFNNDASCIEFIASVRWPGGLLCQKCQCDKFWRADNGLLFVCSACGHKIRPLAGTIFQDSHTPILIWFKAIWQIMYQKYGANATGLSRTLGIAFTTAWNILQKLRRTMV